jgi:endoplasmic reticulum protein 29
MKNIFVLLIFSFINYSTCCTGCVSLDELTFGKVIKKFKTVLVKFDDQFPFGEIHDTWITFANEINNKTTSGTDHPDLLIAVVGVKDYGDLDNKLLAERYGLMKRQDAPIIKLFVDGDVENPIHFEIGKEIKI